MIYEHFRATGASEVVQGLSHLFNIRLQTDDVQDFDVLWDQALLSASETPSDVVLEGLYKTKLHLKCSQAISEINNNAVKFRELQIEHVGSSLIYRTCGFIQFL